MPKCDFNKVALQKVEKLKRKKLSHQTRSIRVRSP